MCSMSLSKRSTDETFLSSLNLLPAVFKCLSVQFQRKPEYSVLFKTESHFLYTGYPLNNTMIGFQLTSVALLCTMCLVNGYAGIEFYRNLIQHLTGFMKMESARSFGFFLYPVSSFLRCISLVPRLPTVNWLRNRCGGSWCRFTE